jgi:hypothetical protein
MTLYCSNVDKSINYLEVQVPLASCTRLFIRLLSVKYEFLSD